MTILNLGASFLVPALRRLGCRVITAGPAGDLPFAHPTSLLTLLAQAANHATSQEESPDFVLYEDDGNLPFVLDPDRAPCLSIFFSVDTFCNPWHLPFAAAFDAALVAQKDFVPLFESEGYLCRWFPLFWCHGARPDPETRAGFARRDVPASFVGTLRPRNIPQRLPFLRRFQRLHPLVLHQGDFTHLFSRSRIVLNQTAASELNFRCFEAMSLGAALLMEDCHHGLRDLFQPGENILPPYPRDNAEAAAAIASDWLQRPDDLADLALAGQRLVLDRHTDDQRARELLLFAQSLLESGASQARLAEQERRRTLMASAYGMIAAELKTPEMRPFRDFFQSLYEDIRNRD